MKAAATRFRVAALSVGVLLLLLTAATLIKFLAGDPRFVTVIGPAHGFGYMVYVAIVLDLAYRARWNVWRTAGVALSGTLPFLSFVIERRVTESLRAEYARGEA